MLAYAVTGKSCRVALRVGSRAQATPLLRSHTLSAALQRVTFPMFLSDTLG